MSANSESATITRESGGEEEEYNNVAHGENCTLTTNDDSRPLQLDDIIKVAVTLSPNEPPPSAFDLFYLNFDVEMARVPTHFRMQRWSKRRIANRWKWITSREREAYETKAAALKQEWLLLRNDGNTKKSKNTSKLKQMAVQTESDKKPVRSTEAKQDGKRKRERAREKLIELIASGESFEESDERALKNVSKMSKEDALMFHGLEDNKKGRRNKRKKRTRQLSPIHIEDFLSDAKVGGPSPTVVPSGGTGKSSVEKKSESSKSSLSCDGTSSSSSSISRRRTSSMRRRVSKCDGPPLQVIQRQQFDHHQQVLERELVAHRERNEEVDDTRSIRSGTTTSSGMSSSSSSSVASVPIDPRLTSKSRRSRSGATAPRMWYEEEKKKKLNLNCSVLDDDESASGGSTPLLESATSSASSSVGCLGMIPSSSRERDREKSEIFSRRSPPRRDLSPNRSRMRPQKRCNERIISVSSQPRGYSQPTILDHISFRKKCSSEIQSGSTCFSSIPCTRNYTDTILFSARDCADLVGLTDCDSDFLVQEMSDFCEFEFGKNKAVCIHELSEEERSGAHKSACNLFVMIQFESRDVAFSCYTNVSRRLAHPYRLDFVQVWFCWAYFARQSYCKSDFGLEKGRFEKGVCCGCESASSHCHETCAHVNPDLESECYTELNEYESCASRDCIMFCCCSLDRKQRDKYSYLDVHVGDVVLWRGTKCCVESIVSSQEIEISMATERRVVHARSLTKVVSFTYSEEIGKEEEEKKDVVMTKNKVERKERNVETMDDLDENFDSHAQLVDGLTVTTFFRNFWLNQGNLGRCKLLFGSS